MDDQPTVGTTEAVRIHAFRSATEATELWTSLGCELKFVQLTAGAMRGHLSVETCGEVNIVTLSCNQGLLVKGQRNPNYLHVSLENTNNIDMHRVWGEPIQPNSVHGFCRDIQESFFQTTPGCQVRVAMVPLRRFESLARLDGAADFMTIIESSNSMVLSGDNFLQMKQLMTPSSQKDGSRINSMDGELIEAHLVDSFSKINRNLCKSVNPQHRHNLIRELVDFAFKNSTSPLKLQDVCHNLFSSPTTITVGCREMFGLGPMALLKRVRLQQVQHVLQNPDLQKSLDCTTIQRISERFGFSSRNHFARDYRTTFGESPLTTMQTSRTTLRC